MKSNVLMVVRKGEVAMVEQELPPLGPKDVLVKVTKSLVSPGTERAWILGLENTGGGENYPFKIHYAAAMVVQSIGPEVTTLVPGDRVSSYGTGHQTYDVVHEEKLVKIPDGVSDEHAAFGALGYICMQGVRKARLEIGESCAIIGMGPIGQLAMQFSKVSGACPVIALDKDDGRLELALECGADITINTGADNWKEKLSEYDLEKGVAATIESTGFPAAIQSALDITGYFGRVVMLGSTRGDCTINVYRDIHKKGLSVIGAHAFRVPETDNSPASWTCRKELETFMYMLSKNKFEISKLVSLRVESKELVDVFYNRILKWDMDLIGVIVNWV